MSEEEAFKSHQPRNAVSTNVRLSVPSIETNCSFFHNNNNNNNFSEWHGNFEYAPVDSDACSRTFFKACVACMSPAHLRRFCCANRKSCNKPWNKTTQINDAPRLFSAYSRLRLGWVRAHLGRVPQRCRRHSPSLSVACKLDEGNAVTS